MANKPLASDATDTVSEVTETLTRGQKAARTRRINDAKRAAEAEAKAKADAEHHARLVKRATENAIKSVPDPKKRKASLDKLAAEQAADAARKEAFAAMLTRKEEVAAEEEELAKKPLWELRALYVDDTANSDKIGRHFAAAITAKHDIDGGWWNAKRSDADRSTNTGTVIADLFVQQDAFFEAVKDKWAIDKALGRKVPLRPNPSRSWNMAKGYAEEAAAIANGDDGKKDKKGPLEPLAAIERDLAALYVRANGHKDFKSKGPKAERLRDATFKIGTILKGIMPDGKWSDLQAKAEAKAKE